jgi:hypothetical protein
VAIVRLQTAAGLEGRRIADAVSGRAAIEVGATQSRSSGLR